MQFMLSEPQVESHQFSSLVLFIQVLRMLAGYKASHTSLQRSLLVETIVSALSQAVGRMDEHAIVCIDDILNLLHRCLVWIRCVYMYSNCEMN